LVRPHRGHPPALWNDISTVWSDVKRKELGGEVA
jgi:hypothetical protein